MDIGTLATRPSGVPYIRTSLGSLSMSFKRFTAHLVLVTYNGDIVLASTLKFATLVVLEQPNLILLFTVY